MPPVLDACRRPQTSADVDDALRRLQAASRLTESLTEFLWNSYGIPLEVRHLTGSLTGSLTDPLRD